MKVRTTNISPMIWLLSVWLLVGCSSSQAETILETTSPAISPSMTLNPTQISTPSPTFLPTTTPSPTLTATPTILPIETSTSTPKQHLFSILPPGDYLAYSTCVYVQGQTDCKLELLSLAGERQGTLLTKGIFLFGSISPDGTQMVFRDEEGRLRLLDLETHASRLFSTADDACFDPDWSPDGNAVVANCIGKKGEDLYIFSLADGTRTRLTDCEELKDGCTLPVFSPDGKWLAYYRGPKRSGVSDTRGLYLIDTVCLAEPATCMDTDRGPFGLYDPQTWSPDGRYLATDNGSTIYIFRVQDGAVSQVQAIETDDVVEAISWSPDGEWIAFTSSSQIFLISVADWTPFLLYDLNNKTPKLYGWITIPPEEE